MAFLTTILVGTLLLMLPASRSGAEVALSYNFVSPAAAPSGVPVFGPSFPGGAPLSVALFTTVSASSVTGLIVVDTGSYWSVFGQTVILILIELGGIGTMTIVTLVASAIRKRATSQDRAIAKVWFGMNPRAVRRSVGEIVAASLILQTIFAIFNSLYLWFSGHAQSPATAIFHGIFLTGSAFNNAGFAPYQDSLMSFSAEPILLVSLALLIIIGGLGFPVWLALYHDGWRWWKWSMHTRIMMLGTGIAILAGWVFITALEWRNTRLSARPRTGLERVFRLRFASHRRIQLHGHYLAKTRDLANHGYADDSRRRTGRHRGGTENNHDHGGDDDRLGRDSRDSSHQHPGTPPGAFRPAFRPRRAHPVRRHSFSRNPAADAPHALYSQPVSF